MMLSWMKKIKKLGFCSIAILILLLALYYYKETIVINPNSSQLSPLKLIADPLVSPTSYLRQDTTIQKKTNNLTRRPLNQKQSLVYYNRVPKCGSSTMQSLMKNLSSQNGFHSSRSPVYFDWHINHKDQEAFVKEVMELPTPAVYNRQVHYINFTSFGAGPPVHINIIRDPIERLMSEYYYTKSITRLRQYSKLNYNQFTATAKRYGDIARAPSNQTFDECLEKQRPGCNRSTDFFVIAPFFCGQDDICLEPSSDSIAKAKHNVISNYLLVGFLEDLASFIEGLEILLPKFFKGACSFAIGHVNAVNEKPQLQKKTLDLLRAKLQEEYDFYYFVKQHFYKKMTSLKKLG